MDRFNKGEKVKFIGDKNNLDHGYVDDMEDFVHNGKVGTIAFSHDGVVIVKTEGSDGGWNYAPREVIKLGDEVAAVDGVPVVEAKPAVLTSGSVEAEEEEDLVVDKQVYGVVDSAGNIKLLTADRDVARATKAGMGGKKKGIVIVAFAPIKEIR